ncbi:MAG TPA: hypothetical protein VGK74_02855 [Symbiobacteriaceae bacterium]|jgi:hypothetical protein
MGDEKTLAEPLAEELEDDDCADCAVEFCRQPAAVIVGPDATELCTEHAADLVTQLVALPKAGAVLDARRREGK